MKKSGRSGTVFTYLFSTIQLQFNTTLYITAGHNILKYPDTLRNMAKEMMQSMFKHYFLPIFLFCFGDKQKYTYTYTYTYTYAYTHTGHMKVMLENGGNFGNGMPILDYIKFTLYLIKFHINAGLKAIFRNST